MSRKSTPYGRRTARLARMGKSLRSDGITIAKMLNTRLDEAEVDRIISTCKAALQSLREVRATYHDWATLCTARHVGIAIEDGGIVRGQRFLFDLGEAALDSISDRCGSKPETWTPRPCAGPELTALADMIAAHSRQVRELTYNEYTRAADLAVSRVETMGGRVYRTAPTGAAA